MDRTYKERQNILSYVCHAQNVGVEAELFFQWISENSPNGGWYIRSKNIIQIKLLAP